MEFLVLQVQGQSFMQHQIRKMIGQYKRRFKISLKYVQVNYPGMVLIGIPVCMRIQSFNRIYRWL